MAQLNEIVADMELEEKGRWETYAGTDFQCRIARTGTPKFQTAVRKLRREAKMRAGVSTRLSAEEQKTAAIPAVAKLILLDWKGYQDKEGNEIPYTVARAEELLRMPAMHDWYDWVIIISGDADLFRGLDVDEDGDPEQEN